MKVGRVQRYMWKYKKMKEKGREEIKDWENKLGSNRGVEGNTGDRGNNERES